MGKTFTSWFRSDYVGKLRGAAALKESGSVGGVDTLEVIRGRFRIKKGNSRLLSSQFSANCRLSIFCGEDV